MFTNTKYTVPAFSHLTDALWKWSDEIIAESKGYTFYNKFWDDKEKVLTIQLAFAGYKKSDIIVELFNDELTIKTPNGSSVLPSGEVAVSDYRGISNKKHNLKFKLTSGAVVNKVAYEDGLLTIKISNPNPEVSKVRNLEIN